MRASDPLEVYFRRFGYCPRQIAAPPPAGLGLVVVIPCYDEPDLVGTLESLRQCRRPDCGVEVIVVVNGPADAPDEVRAHNLATLESARAWASVHGDGGLGFHILDATALPPRQAGVGLARKIGMDEALRRLGGAGRPEGVIAGFDADCRCDPDYLVALDRHFREQPDCPGCSIHFEHRADGSWPAGVRAGIHAYELHLRYYLQGLRYAGFPDAHHTIGSCMAVRAEAYRKQGGMNKRRAGEDFYFLHKIMALGGFADLAATTVYPSPRPSHRVPFGTGRAVRDFLADGSLETYPLKAFLDLRRFFEDVGALYRREAGAEAGKALPGSEALDCFLEAEGFPQALAEVRANTSSDASFRKRFFRWFDGFRVMKFIHHARDRHYGRGRIEEEAGRLLVCLEGGPGAGAGGGLEALLERYRRLERGVLG